MTQHSFGSPSNYHKCYIWYPDLGKLLHKATFPLAHSPFQSSENYLQPWFVLTWCWMSLNFKLASYILLQETFSYILTRLACRSFLKKVPGRSLCAVKQITIPRPKSEVGRNTLWYKGLAIKFPESLTSLKTLLENYTLTYSYYIAIRVTGRFSITRVADASCRPVDASCNTVAASSYGWSFLHSWVKIKDLS